MTVSLIKATDTPTPTVPDAPVVTMYEGPTMGTDKRETMPSGGYVFGRSNAALRPVVPKGQ